MPTQKSFPQHLKIIFLRFPIDFVSPSSETFAASFGLSLVGGQIALSEK